MKVAEFNYELPEELIAQTPIQKRDESRLMILNKQAKTIEHKVFKDIIEYLQPGDVLVRNNTKVIPARLYGKKETGAKVEFLLLNNIEGDTWECIVRPGNKLHVGTKVFFGDGMLTAEILEIMRRTEPEKYNFITKLGGLIPNSQQYTGSAWVHRRLATSAMAPDSTVFHQENTD